MKALAVMTKANLLQRDPADAGPCVFGPHLAQMGKWFSVAPRYRIDIQRPSRPAPRPRSPHILTLYPSASGGEKCVYIGCRNSAQPLDTRSGSVCVCPGAIYTATGKILLSDLGPDVN